MKKTITVKNYIPFNTLKEFVEAYGLTDSLWHFRLPINKLDFPRLSLKANDEGMRILNELIAVLDKEKVSRRGLSRTKSGGICQASKPGYDVDKTKSGIELLFMDFIGEHIRGFRVSFSSMAAVNELGVTGRGSFFKMKEEFLKDGVDLEKYAVENGKEIKETITKPLIEMGLGVQAGVTYHHVNHIDLHSAYPSGLCRRYPEMLPTCKRIYENRKRSDQDKKLKLQMDAAIGYFQSQYCRINHHGYSLAPLAKTGVHWCKNTIYEIAKELTDQHKQILLYNTDGIWYVDDEGDFRSEWIGEGLGKAGIDHKDCTLRIKSKGAYEYIENGIYTPVVRGVPKSKSEKWTWGGIFTPEATVFEYTFDERTFRIIRREAE